MSRARRPRSPLMRLVLFSTGMVLIVLSPFVGIIPGPGGIPVFAAGLVLALQNSAWARRTFVRLKARWRWLAKLSDLALRRRSVRRRKERAKALAAAGAAVREGDPSR